MGTAYLSSKVNQLKLGKLGEPGDVFTLAESGRK